MKSKSKDSKRTTPNDQVVVVIDDQQSKRETAAKESNDDIGTGFSNKEVRRNFVRKVYTILAIQMLLTVTIGVVMFSIRDVRIYFAEHRFWAIIASLMATIPLLIMCCVPSTGRTVPTNYILLSLFTLFQGFAIGVISCCFKTDIILLAMGTTVVVVIVITILACSPLFDITNCGLLLLILTIVHMIMLIIGIVIIIAFNIDFRIVNLVLSIAGAFLFSLWLAYDTQLIIGGKSHELSPEDYVYGAIALYIDITQIFLNILSIFGNN